MNIQNYILKDEMLSDVVGGMPTDIIERRCPTTLSEKERAKCIKKVRRELEKET